MATQLENPTKRAKPASTASRIDGYVSNQLKKTSRQVRVSDIATGSLSIAAFVLAFFLVVAIVDAWIWPLTFFARVAALCFLIGGTALIGWFKLVPYFFKKINPQFAAKMIEETKPDFKNSLLNYLSLKKSPNKKKVHRAILNEVSRKAATDLSTITPDAAVDKSILIRTGFILVALVAALIAYSIFSPKNPLPTFMRVLSPGSKIAHPAAVSINVLTPRDADVFFGDKPEVTAKVYGVSEQDEIHLVYSSLDSQIVDAFVPMKYTGENNTYAATLATGPSGIQQSLTYRIEAGDGISPQYRISVRPNPSITIDSVRITPPKYTGLPERIIEGQGEIQAVEGAKVEINAKANLPIELAYIVPLIAKNQSAENRQFRELRTIQMKSENQQATGRMTVGLNSNRDRALFTHYKINFLSKDSYKNERPNIYPIRVIADLAPEIEFVAPAAREVTAPVNQPLPIEIWASDLDYELSAIDMFIDHDGRQVCEKNLFDSRKDKTTQDRVQARTSITPAELGLKDGDRAILYAVAADNRISSSSELPDPNKTRSENYTLIITAPVETQQKNDESETGENGEENSEQKNSQDSDSGSDDSQANEENSEQSQADSTNQDDGNSGEDNSSGSQNGSGDESGDTDQPSEAEEKGSENSGSSEENSESQDNNDADSSSSNKDQKDDQGSESGDGSDQTDEPESNSDSKSSDGNEGDMTSTNDDQSSDGSTSAEGGNNENSGQRGRQGDQDSPNSDGEANGEEFRDDSLTEGNEPQPLDKDAHPGEQIERLKEYFDNKQKQKNQSQSSGDQSDEQNAADRQTSDANSQDNSENQRPTDPPENPQQGSPQDSAADGNRAEDAGDQEQKPSQNSEARGGGDDQRKPEEAADGNPEKPAEGGQETDNGTPDQNSTGEGSESKSENGEQSGSSSDQKDADSQSSGNPEESQNSSNGEPSAQQSSGNDAEQNGNENSQPSSDGGQPTSNQNSDQQNTGQPAESNSQQPDSNSTIDSNSQGDSSDSSQNPGNKTEQQNDSSVSEKGHRGGASGNTTSPNENPESVTPRKEKPNLEYAKKVTDLVLNQLEDQKYDPDQELLDQMNWTQQDLDDALRQWKQMKANAENGNPVAQRKYIDWLESLGITPKTQSRTAKVKKDQEFKLNESGAVDMVPREYLEEFNSYLKRRNRSKRQ